MVKDNYGHVSLISIYEDLVKSSVQGDKGQRGKAGGQVGTADGQTNWDS